MTGKEICFNMGGFEKEKALAELAALYTLKKKAEDIWGESEDD